MKHELPKLVYSYGSLEPFIDSKTMEIHHSKHHQTYVDKLNVALDKRPELFEKRVEELLKDIASVPHDIKQAVVNHGGGHANHSLFWEIMCPGGKKISEKFEKEISKSFGSFENFKKEFSDLALAHFGSGWCWLVVSDGKLKVINTNNQDSPLMHGKKPVLGLDVWEHAYYLKYQNKRADYIKDWWNVVNWEMVEKLFEEGK